MLGWGAGSWGSGFWGALDNEDANLGFEIDHGIFQGMPASWTLDNIPLTSYDRASFAENYDNPRESFEKEWDNDDYRFENNGLSFALFGSNDHDGFEVGWATAVFELIGLELALFGGSTTEDFEDDWNNDIFDIELGTIEDAEFNTSNDLSEGFEIEWDDNEDYLYEFQGIGVDLEPAVFGLVNIKENFEQVKDPITITVLPSSNEIFASSHGLVLTDQVYFSNIGGRLPMGLQPNTVYEVATVVDPDTIKVMPVGGNPGTDIVDVGDYGIGQHLLQYDPVRFWTSTITL
jgi:hypothetical protein